MFWCSIHEAEKPSKCAVLVGVGDMWVSGTCGCWGHVGVGDKWVSGTCVLGDLWVWGTCGCGGHVGEGDMRVSGTCGCGGHEGVGDLFSGGLVCLIPLNLTQTLSIHLWKKRLKPLENLSNLS